MAGYASSVNYGGDYSNVVSREKTIATTLRVSRGDITFVLRFPPHDV